MKSNAKKVGGSGPARPKVGKARLRSIRRSATVSPFGVGAIYDFGDESLVAMDTFHWEGKGETINLPRLERELGVDHFKMAPIAKERFNPYVSKVPYHRFPQWLFCSACRAMTRWSSKKEKLGEQPRCSACAKQAKLMPMRFVVACEDGHLSDVPWVLWAHSLAESPAEKQCAEGALFFKTKRGGGGGLGSLWVVCQTCHAGRSLAGIARMDSLKRVIRSCENRQPWQWADSSGGPPCPKFPQVLQRGATNLYFPTVPSALDIPDDKAKATDLLSENVKNHDFYKFMRTAAQSTTSPLEDPGVQTAATIISGQLKCPVERVLQVLKDELNPVAPQAEAAGPEALLREEWDAFLNPPPEEESGHVFLARPVDLATWYSQLDSSHPAQSLAPVITSVVLAKRLREVRALQGFERLKPGSTRVRPDLGRRLNWLPGIEVFGEGIFIALNEERIQSWERANSAALEQRLGPMRERRNRSTLAFLPKFSCRFVLLHTLAHALIRQLSFECGYASSSLRERIYAEAPSDKHPGMAGLLIYTAAGDSEGSLGGLVREGQPERLLPTLLTSLQSQRWCSADPICRELPAQGLQGLNRAACHACALVSETSCVAANVMLDRAVLVGDGSCLTGFLGHACDALEGTMFARAGE